MHFTHKASITLAALTALGMTAAVPASAQSYTFTALDDPAAIGGAASNGSVFAGTFASGINDAGQVVGYYFDSAGVHGFQYVSSTGFATIDNPAAIFSTGNGVSGSAAFGISNTGSVTGTYSDTTNSHGYFYKPGTGYTSFNPPATGPNSSTIGFGINASGIIVGNYADSTSQHAYLYNPNAGGSSPAFTTLADPLATRDTNAYGINDLGQVVGDYRSGTSLRSFLYTPATGSSSASYTSFSDPVGLSTTSAHGINSAGQIVGFYFNNTGRHGFLAMPGAAGSPLTFTTIDNPVAPHGIELHGINASGQIVGYYADANNVEHSFLATPVAAAVPEVSGFASLGLLLMIGAGGVLAVTRRRRGMAA